ncbi:MAG TPA: CoA transferase [Dehalococcoidia bacterium]|nr:CoA transferase [Dehalococcoidia bacterium]
MPDHTNRTGPLSRLRVLDLTSGVAGPWCTKLLADYGADVIKAEPPGTGDDARGHGAFPDGVPHREESALFLWLNTSKRGITLDVRTATGRALALRLAARCDAVVHDWRPAEVAALRLGYDDFRAANPRIVVTSVTAFGQSGPYADWLQPNLISFAAGGQHYLAGDPDREPLQSAGYQASYQAGAQAFGATLAALWDAAQAGEGQAVEVAGMEVMASIMELYVPDAAYRKSEALQKRRGNFMSAAVGIYPTADGHIGIHAMPKNWPQLVEAMDARWMATDERFADNRARLMHDDELSAALYGWAATVTKHEAYERAGKARAPVAPVNTVGDLLESEHLRERGFFHHIEHPLAGSLPHPGAPARMPASPPEQSGAPMLGEHNVDVYCGMLGLAPADLATLSAGGVI